MKKIENNEKRKNIYPGIFIGIILMPVLIAICCSMVTSCNHQIIDTTYTFDRAIIQISNDEVIEIKVASWKDYDGSDQIQIKAKNGTTYLVHSSNVTLIHDESE